MLEHFDADIHDLLRSQKERAESQLDRVTRFFWWLTQYVLAGQARFDTAKLGFELQTPPVVQAPAGFTSSSARAKPRPSTPASTA